MTSERSLRIAVNTLSVTDDNEGIRTMLPGLVTALVRNDPTNRYRLICSHANLGLFSSLEDRVDVTLVPERRRRPLARVVHDQVTVPWLVRREVDVLLTPSSVGSVAATVPQVVVLVAHLAVPSIRREAGVALSPPHRLYYGPVMRLSHRRADAVVAISDFLAGRVADDMGDRARAKVVSIPCGIDLPVPDASPRQAGDGAPAHRHLLLVGTLYPYKNVDAAIRALALARARVPDGLPLVVAGRDPDGTQVAALRRTAVEVGVTDLVTFAGKVSAEELEDLYAGAVALVFPSRAEGFGFPAVEAMARGVPVIAADRTSLPEVVGSAGLLVDPDRHEELAEAFVRVASEPALRARLAEAGRVRAAELSWDTAAAAFIELFARVAAKRRRPGQASGPASRAEAASRSATAIPFSRGRGGRSASRRSLAPGS